MTSEERAALRASLDPTYVQPAPAPAAKKSKTSGSGRGVSGRGRDSIVFKEATPEQLAKDQAESGLRELERGQAGELTYGAMGDDGKRSKLKADIDQALAFSKTAKDAGSPETGYDLVKRQEKSVDELIERYGVDLPVYLKYAPLPKLDRRFSTPAFKAHKAQHFGQAMKKEKARDKKIYTGAIARTKALELVTGGDSKKGIKLKELVDASRDGNLDFALEHFDLPPEYDTPEAKAELAKLIETIVEAEPKKQKDKYEDMITIVPLGKEFHALTQTVLDEVSAPFKVN